MSDKDNPKQKIAVHVDNGDSGGQLSLVLAAEIGFPSFLIGNQVYEVTGGSLWPAWLAGLAIFFGTLIVLCVSQVMRYFFAFLLSLFWGYIAMEYGNSILAFIIFFVSFGLHLAVLNDFSI